MKKKTTATIFSVVIIGLFAASSYMTWNRLDPQYTCALCHEVSPSHSTWLTSAHAGLSCAECHGTALSNGVHSLSEKMRMIYVHIKGGTYNDDIRLTEKQVLQVSGECARCHQSEYAGWLAGGHAVNYKEIFMDSVHNAMERPYWDCFRCHGMFYEGTIHDLMDLSGEHHEWRIKDGKQAYRPVVPCLACHQIHTENPVSERYVSMTDTTRAHMQRNPKTALYVRADKQYLRSDRLTAIQIYEGDRAIDHATDPSTLLCMQCHSPNYRHCAGSEDDRTVVGVHGGLSCIACHHPHSGETKSSCMQCHPSLTDQQIEQVYRYPHSFRIEHTKEMSYPRETP